MKNSITSRGTGCYMNAKLIKDCKITRIRAEQRFEPIVKTARAIRVFRRFSHMRASSISTASLFTVMFRS